MSIKISNMSISIDANFEDLKKLASKKLKLKEEDFQCFKVLRESVDARKKDNIKLNYTLEIKCGSEKMIISKLKDKDVAFLEEKTEKELTSGDKKLNYRPIIIGMGPAGMFAGLLMARKGLKPLIFERGQCVEERTAAVNKFWTTGILDAESNVQFGEGGAGTFSDGKLTTRIKDERCDFILEELVKSGAPEEILYSGKPHIGTDILKKVVMNIRKQIIELGGEIYFRHKLEKINIKDNAIKSIIVNEEEIPCEILVLAIGHSSRDTYEMLYNKGISMETKPFAIGVRIEHLRKKIDVSQYGKFADHPKLRAADYRLTYTSEKLNRGIYTFCMCPGGEVVAAASEKERLVTNGMSYYGRDLENSNSAMVVTVDERDFNKIPGSTKENPLKAMEFQRYYENLAYKLGGSNYSAPVQLVGDFIKDRNSTVLGSINPSYKPGYEFRMLNECLPEGVISALKEGLINFDKKIPGFAAEDVVMTGIESRTSSPVRIIRDENLESITLRGLYPAGEGAGYAGGIISAAVDGVKIAENIIKQYNYQK